MMAAFVMQKTVDLVGDHYYAVLAEHFGQRAQFGCRITEPLRIAGMIEDQDAGHIFVGLLRQASP